MTLKCNKVSFAYEGKNLAYTRVVNMKISYEELDFEFHISYEKLYMKT